MILGCGRPAQPLLRHTDVPQRVTESFILSGYRFPNYSLRECLASAFRPTNETGNFWTHFLAVFVFAFHFLELFAWDSTPSFSDPFFYPLWNYFIGVFCLLMASSLAHLLNSMSLLIREICFFVDYGTISAYTVGSALAYFYYIHPQAGIAGAGFANATQRGRGAPGGPSPQSLALPSPPSHPEFHVFFESFYIPSACLVALICTLACCNTRHRWRRYRYVIRTAVFLLPFVVASTPVFYRLLRPSSSPSSSSSSSSQDMLAPYFYRHCFWLAVSALFNISKFPERLSPGSFDVWGHSHQWFHCCTFLSILDELHMIKAEIRALGLHPVLALPAPPSRPHPHIPGPTLGSTYGVMFALQGCIAGIISWFAWNARESQKESSKLN
ncbi:membrane progesterone receptor epsilon [Megalops cyprinoides]|uniref:membrane progesterone receptor epsilon n=1 Tax=Megalops cyprinoides TaxID=118141 RepID=UPI001864CC2D|nr:membrane progesterone receptor epsilon [Megalops cyprinoides]XP_036404270.1 membrane progesterone receptor epsilon [Megalops cyprinoides]